MTQKHTQPPWHVKVTQKHTPPPWHVKGGTPLVGIDRPYDIIAGASLIAQTLMAPERSAAAANAVLIAAAPELLALAYDFGQMLTFMDPYTVDDAAIMRDKIKAAITRATGPTP